MTTEKGKQQLLEKVIIYFYNWTFFISSYECENKQISWINWRIAVVIYFHHFLYAWCTRVCMEVVESQSITGTSEKIKKVRELHTIQCMYLMKLCILFEHLHILISNGKSINWQETHANRTFAGYGSTLVLLCSYFIGKTLPARQREERGKEDGHSGDISWQAFHKKIQWRVCRYEYIFCTFSLRIRNKFNNERTPSSLIFYSDQKMFFQLGAALGPLSSYRAIQKRRPLKMD